MSSSRLSRRRRRSRANTASSPSSGTRASAASGVRWTLSAASRPDAGERRVDRRRPSSRAAARTSAPSRLIAYAQAPSREVDGELRGERGEQEQPARHRVAPRARCANTATGPIANQEFGSREQEPARAELARERPRAARASAQRRGDRDRDDRRRAPRTAAERRPAASATVKPNGVSKRTRVARTRTSSADDRRDDRERVGGPGSPIRRPPRPRIQRPTSSARERAPAATCPSRRGAASPRAAPALRGSARSTCPAM